MARDTNVVTGTLIMLVLSVLLFWLPVAGPLLAGFVGGRRAGSAGAGFLAAILPALVVGALIFVLVTMLPGIGAFIAGIFAAALTLWLVVQGGLVLVGGLLGGWSADRGESRGVRTVG